MPTLKLNLTALHTEKEDQNVTHEEIIKEENSVGELGEIQHNTQEKPKNEAKNIKDIDSQGEVSFDNHDQRPDLLSHQQQENGDKTGKTQKFRLSAFSLSGGQRNKKAPQNPDPASNDTEQVESGKPKEEIKFHNYESSFVKEKNKIFKKIRNFKYAPKTRIGFIMSLLAITFGSLGCLMILNPEKNSIEVYKASLMDIYQGRPSRVEVDTEEGEKDPTGEGIIDNQEQELPREEEKEEAEKREVKKERLRKHLLEKYSG